LAGLEMESERALLEEAVEARAWDIPRNDVMNKE
jgi:hypothetical protein